MENARRLRQRQFLAYRGKVLEGGLKYGYANFWWAESVTMFSNGKVEIANVYAGEAGIVRDAYQLNNSAFDNKKGAENYFLMLTDNEIGPVQNWIEQKKAEGLVIDEFIIVTEPYDLRGFSGTTLYIYVSRKTFFNSEIQGCRI